MTYWRPLEMVTSFKYLGRVIHLDGGGKVGGGIFYDGGVYQAAAEHGCTVHC